MDKENVVYIPSGYVLTKESTEAIYELAKNPIKIICEDNVEITIDGDYITINKRIIGIEGEKFISNIFGTTNIGIFDCSDMSHEEIESIVSEE